MEISIFKQWANNGCDFEQGVALYEQYGDNAVVKNLLANGESYFAKIKLKAVLLDLDKKCPKEIIKIISPKELPTVADFKVYREPKKKIDPTALPDSLKKMYYELGPLWNHTKYLHFQLAEAQSDEARKEIAFQILDNASTRRAIYNEIDTFVATGKLLTPEPTAQTPKNDDTGNILELTKELLRLRAQRSKLKKKPHRAKDYQVVLTRIAEIETLLKDGDN